MVVRRSSHSRTGIPVFSSTRAAKARYSSARGPSVPSMFRGKPITSSSACRSLAIRATSSAARPELRLWTTVVYPASSPEASDTATPVRTSP